MAILIAGWVLFVIAAFVGFAFYQFNMRSPLQTPIPALCIGICLIAAGMILWGIARP